MKKVCTCIIVFVMIMAMMIPSMAAYQQDIGSYNTTIGWATYTIYPTQRYRYASTNMVDNLEGASEYESGNEMTIRTGVVNTSNSLVTYEYDINAPKRKSLVVRYSAPVGSYYKLRHKAVLQGAAVGVVGTWAPNDKN